MGEITVNLDAVSQTLKKALVWGMRLLGIGVGLYFPLHWLFENASRITTVTEAWQANQTALIIAAAIYLLGWALDSGRSGGDASGRLGDIILHLHRAGFTDVQLLICGLIILFGILYFMKPQLDVLKSIVTTLFGILTGLKGRQLNLDVDLKERGKE
jgi:hypothetical protein